MPGPRSETRFTGELDRRGIRYGWMAKQLGVRPWTFSRIEKGIQHPPSGYYDRAARILGVDVADITPLEEAAA